MINSIADFFQNLFSPVVGVLGVVLRWFHYDLGLEWWLSIAAITILLRMIMFPLTIKQVQNMRAMQKLRPDMEKVRAQYRNNRQRQQEEIMKLYRERSINPLGGCLPVVVQMPVFIGIFYVIRQFGGYRGTTPTEPSFQQGGILWFQNLSEMDSYFILPVLSAATMFAASWITAKSMEPQQRIAILALPLVITVFLWNFPAGLFVYWITSNLVTLGQNAAIYNFNGVASIKSVFGANDGGKVGMSPPASEAPSERDVAAQAAKSSKRKRRKKKR